MFVLLSWEGSVPRKHGGCVSPPYQIHTFPPSFLLLFASLFLLFLTLAKGGGREVKERVGKRIAEFYNSVWMGDFLLSELGTWQPPTLPGDTFVDILAIFTSGKYFLTGCICLPVVCLDIFPQPLKIKTEVRVFGAFSACPSALLHKNQDMHFLSAVIIGFQDAPRCGLIPNEVFLPYSHSLLQLPRT